MKKKDPKTKSEGQNIWDPILSIHLETNKYLQRKKRDLRTKFEVCLSDNKEWASVAPTPSTLIGKENFNSPNIL